MKVKIFESESYYSESLLSQKIENNINAWLSTHRDIKIHFIKTEVIGNILVTQVWYS